jgi:hypothetical protein
VSVSQTDDDKCDGGDEYYSLIVVPVTPEVNEEDTRKTEERKRAWNKLRPVLDVLGTVFWIYVFLQVFIVDVDSAVLGPYAPYRFFIFAAIAVFLALTVKRTWPILATFGYMLCFPLVVLCWKFPKTLYRTRSPIVFLAAANAVTGIFVNIRRSIVVGGAVAFASLVIAVSHARAPLVVAAGALALLIVSAVYRTIRASVVPNRFLTVQQSAIRRAFAAKFMQNLLEPSEELRNPEIEKFNAGQQQQLIQSLGNAVISHRILNLWAYQLDRYRRSPASILLTAWAYFWLLLRAVVGLTFINLAVFHADSHAFAYEAAPSFLTFMRYVIAGLYGGEIHALSPVSELANGVSIATFVIGVLVLGSAVISSALSYRASRDDSDFTDTISRIREESDRLDEQLRQKYDVSVAEGIRRLEDLRFGLMGVITSLSTRIPKDFEGPSSR